MHQPVVGASKSARLHGVLVREEIISKKSQRGVKRKYDPDMIVEATKQLPMSNRGDWESMAEGLDIPKTTLYRLKGKGLRRISSALKPRILDEHRVA